MRSSVSAKAGKFLALSLSMGRVHSCREISQSGACERFGPGASTCTKLRCRAADLDDENSMGGFSNPGLAGAVRYQVHRVHEGRSPPRAGYASGSG